MKKIIILMSLMSAMLVADSMAKIRLLTVVKNLKKYEKNLVLSSFKQANETNQFLKNAHLEPEVARAILLPTYACAKAALDFASIMKKIKVAMNNKTVKNNKN